MLKRELQAFVDRYPFVGFVDGAGLLIRMELVTDKKTKEPLPRRVTERIFTEACGAGLLTMAYAASFRIQPSLTIDEATAKNGVAILREVFDVVERERLWQAVTPAAAGAAVRLARQDRARHRRLVRLRPRAVHARPRGHDRDDPALPAGAARTVRSPSPRRRWS